MLDTMIEAIGLAVAGRAGARLAARLGIHVSRDTLLRVVRAIPDGPIETTPILGIDDFALRRGHVYGTVVVDLTSGRPIDLLPDRTSDTVSTWLQAHPGAEIVCRDRPVPTPTPSATGHPMRCRSPTDGTCAQPDRRRGEDRDPAQERTFCADRPPRDDAVIAEAPDGRLVVRTCERHAAVHELHTQGMSISGIARKLNLNRRTVRRFVHAPDIDELLATSRMSGGHCHVN